MHAMGGQSIRVTRSVSIPLADIDVKVSRSSGPGGQHANTADTRVVATLDLTTTTGLTDRQRERVVRRLGPVLRVTSQDERSQLRNRERALERLADRLREALRVERRRVPTAPSAAARERRLEGKRRRAGVKRARGRPEPDE
jgi:ribosome-associated protein